MMKPIVLVDSYRDGCWVGRDKDECGIHLPVNTDGDGI
jgi:phosphoadenosine phosphosulfate reductase